MEPTRHDHVGVGQLVPGDEDGLEAGLAGLGALPLDLEGVAHAVRRRLDHDVGVRRMGNRLEDAEQYLLVTYKKRELGEVTAVDREAAPDWLTRGISDHAFRAKLHAAVAALNVVEVDLVLLVPLHLRAEAEGETADHELLALEQVCCTILDVCNRHGYGERLRQLGRDVEP